MSFMKDKKTKKTEFMTMKINAPLRKRIVEMAQKEHRSLADQITFLVEKGLSANETAQTAGVVNG